MNTAKRITTAFALSLAAAAWVGCSAQNGGSLTDPNGATPGGGGGSNGGQAGPDGTGSDPGTTGGTNGGSTTPTTGDAKSLFTTKVYSLLKTGQPQGKAQCTACHVTGVSGATVFLGADAESSYTAMQTQGMISSPANSKLLLHGEHTGPALTNEQAAAITEWLNAETASKGLPGGGTGPGTGTNDGGTTTVTVQTLAGALDGFASCMDINDWNTNGLQNLYQTQTNAGNGNPSCGDCHAQGDGGNYMSANQTQTFQMNKLFPYVKRMVSGTVDPNTGAFKGLVASKRWELKGTESQQCNRATQNCHPRYTLNTNQINGINAFVSKTLTKLAAGTCGTTAGTDAGK